MAGGDYAFDDPDQAAAFGTAGDDEYAKSQQQIAQAQKAFADNRAFRNYIQAIAERSAKKDKSAPETQIRYSPDTMY